MKGAQFLLPALFKTLLLPPLLAHILILINPPPLRVLRYILYTLSFPGLFILRSIFASISTSQWASSVGAVDIPRVKGRWPFNLDVLSDWARSGSEEEAGWMMILLGRKYGGTYNTRVLGEDQVRKLCSSPDI